MCKPTVNSSNHQRVDPSSTRQARERLAAVLRAHTGALVVGVIFLLLSVLYNVAIPAWEADNELSHFNYVRYLVDQRTLPRADAQVVTPVMVDACRSGEERIQIELTHQFRQPPLYYLLGALATGWIDADGAGPAAANPFRMWDPNQLGYNFALHNLAQERPPYSGTLLALHALRLMSGLVGLLGLVATYLLGLLLFGGRRPLALAMMAINAFIPQYVFASAIVNNDILIAALSAWCLYWCAVAVLRAPRLRFVLLAGFTAGLAVLAKYNGIVLLAPVTLAALAVLRAAWRQSRRHFVATLLPTALVIAVVSVPAVLWLLRNQTIYGQWLGSFATTSGYIDELLGDLTARSAPDFWEATLYAFSTFWGQFGWDTLILPRSILVVLAAASLVAMLGIVLLLADRRQPRANRGAVLAAVGFLVLVSLQAFIRAGDSLEPRGRYLFPGLAVICFLLVAGWQRILPERYQLVGLRALWAGFLVLAVATPFMLLRPAYAPPRLASSAELLPGEQPINAAIGGLAELVGYRIEPERISVGEPVEVTLVWRALRATPNNYTLSIHLVDGDNFPRAWVMSHPGRGNYPTSAWQPGDIFRDRYTLYWADTPWDKLPSMARLKVALFCPGSATVNETYLETVDAQGNALGDAVYFGRAKAAAPDEQTAAVIEPTDGHVFGDEIALVSLTTSKYNPVLPGDVTLTIPLLAPDSRYEIQVGLYDPVSGRRLPLLDPVGQRLQDDRMVAAVIETPKYRALFPVVEVGYEHSQ